MLPEAIFCRVEDTLLTRGATRSLRRCVQENASARAGRSTSSERVDAWFDGAAGSGLWQRPVVAEVLAAQLAGVPLVVIGDLPASCLDAIVQACGAEDVLSSTAVGAWGQPASRDADAASGEARARAVLDWCRRRDIDPARCRAYGADEGSAPVLDAVGEGIAVAHTPSMRALAEQRGWRTIDVSSGETRPADFTFVSWP